MTAPTVVILAAGQGTRMRSALPKVLHPLCGRPLVHWPIHAARDAGAGRIVVVDSAARPLDGHLPEDVVLAVQERPDGTAGALEAAAAVPRGRRGHRPARATSRSSTTAFVSELIAAHAASGAAATMATMLLDDPGDYGRVLRDDAGGVDGRRRGQGGGDATGDQLAIREVNTGIFAFDAARAARRAAAGRLRQRAGRALPARRPAGAARRPA